MRQPRPPALLALLLCLPHTGCPAPARESKAPERRRPPPKPAPRPTVDVLYTDLDGTLFNKDTAIDQVNLAALRRYQARGGRVGFATGRMFRTVKHIPGLIRADLPLIYSNGALITDARGKLLRMLVLTDARAVRTACKLVREAGCGFLYTAHGNPKTGATTIHRDECAPPTDPALGVVKIRASHCIRLEWLLPRLRGAVGKRIHIVEAGDGRWRGVSMAAMGVGKDKALEFVRARLNLDVRRMAFVGDSGNDVSAAAMIHRRGGRCFAVSNAGKPLRAVCPNVTQKDHRNGAVAEVIRRLLESPQ
ncbi:MAG: HAD-IIB family hydrolase [bacterium]